MASKHESDPLQRISLFRFRTNDVCLPRIESARVWCEYGPERAQNMGRKREIKYWKWQSVFEQDERGKSFEILHLD